MQKYVISLEEASLYLGSSPQATYISDYLRQLGAKTLLIEHNYIDRDYIIDYAKFFSRSHQNFERLTNRLHFFSIKLTEEKFETELNNRIIKESNEFISDIQKNYLGFIILKPMFDGKNHNLIGRTVLKIPDKLTNIYESGKFLIKENEINLYGIPLTLATLPFQEQDTAVAACATIALWTANNKLNGLFGTPQLSPYEVTEIATNYIEKSRSFPTEGLTIEQMLNFLRNINLDYDVINISYIKSLLNDESLSEKTKSKYRNMLTCIILDAIRAFLESELPLMAGIKLYQYDKNGLINDIEMHAVTISGYKQNENGVIDEIYVHDDQIGPYSPVESASQNGSFLEWNCALKDDYGINKVELEYLIIPIYPKMRLTFSKIFGIVMEKRREYPDFTIEAHLMNVKNYKEGLLPFLLSGKIKFLERSLPRFVWIISVFASDMLIYEEIYDATSHYIRYLCTIDFYNSCYIEP